jgi:soluble lytic murein transglycosylase-like protein
VPDESGNYKIFILAQYNAGANSGKSKGKNQNAKRQSKKAVSNQHSAVS